MVGNNNRAMNSIKKHQSGLWAPPVTAVLPSNLSDLTVLAHDPCDLTALHNLVVLVVLDF